MHRVVMTAVVLAAAGALAGCGGGPQEVGRADGAEGVASVLGTVATALPDGDGARVCSLMSPQAQRRLEQRTGNGECLGAVREVAGTLDGAALRGLPDAEIETRGDAATVRGEAAGALAEALGVSTLRLTRIEERWLLG